MNSSRSLMGLMYGSLLTVTALLSSSAFANSHPTGGKSNGLSKMPSSAVHAHDEGDCGPGKPQLTLAQKQARLKEILQPVAGAKIGSFAEVSRLITRAQWNELSKPHRAMLAEMLRAKRSGQELPAYCFAPGTDLTTINTFEGAQASLNALRIGGRWTQTATNASVTRGKGMTLTWNLVADGTPVSIGGTNKPSSLRQRVRTAFGVTDANDDSNLKALFTSMFARYEQLTGIRYIYEENDNGSVIDGSFNPGKIGVLADVRIGGASIDGASKILAFNYFPNSGDMVIDTDESNALYTQSVFPQTISHEHGHGLGLDHTCPTNQSKLMEPFVNGRFSSSQLDDVLGIQRNYGDTNEVGSGNETRATSTPLGIQSVGTSTTGFFPSVAVNSGAAVPGSYPYITTQEPVGIDGSTDFDMYSFSVDATGRSAAITLRPMGEPYLEGSQNGDGTCSAGTLLNPKVFSTLKVELRRTDGRILAESGPVAAGQNVTIDPVGLSGTGPFYVRVFENGADANQLYSFDLTIGSRANNAPNVNVTVTPSAPTASDTLTANVTTSDPDGDAVTLSYQWFRNDVAIAGATNSTLNLATIPGAGAGATFRVTVTASDGNPPPATATASVSINETPSLIVTTLDDVTAQDGFNSLREAMTYAATLTGAQTVSFVTGLNGTINLSSELPAIGKALTLTGRSGLEISGQDNTRVTTISAAGALTTTNLIFKNGRQNGLNFGGLFFVNGGRLTATDCVLKDSGVQNFAGAVFASANSTLAFTRCTISNNTAFGAGAFWLDGASASFDTCTLSNNRSTGGGNSGGAVFARQSDGAINSVVTLLNCQVNSNSSSGNGGAISIVANGSTGSARNSTFSSNVAIGDGGAWADGNQNTPFVNCTFNSNTATGKGGAIYDFQAMRVVNCTFKGNNAPQGSAIGSANSQTSLQNNIFDATGQSASIVAVAGGSGIFNSRGNNIASDSGGGFLTGSNDRINLAPGLASLANNGGNVTTISLNDGSPAINKGNDADAADINNNGNTTELLSTILVTDARGASFPRKVGGTVDIGAFESNFLNNPPKLNNATYTGAVSSSFLQQLPGTDADGDTLTYALASGFTLPAGLTLSSTGLISGTPTAVGRTDFSVNVGDGKDTITAKFIIIVSAAGTDGVGPVMTRGPLNPSYTRAGLASLVYTGTVRDIAQTATPAITPVGVKQLLFQLRQGATAYSGNATDGFTTDLNRGYFPAFLGAPSPAGPAGTSTFRRNFASFIPSTLAAGSYSIVILGQDNLNNFSVEVVPVTITVSAAQAAKSPFGAIGSGGGS